MSESTDASPRRIYLDNAATTWPKSTAALQAAEEFTRDCGATAGRGAYRSGMTADRWLSTARTNLARLVKAHAAASVAICNSGTHALNAALWGLVRTGDHVITTGIDHNSLLRPLKNMETHGGIRLSVVPSDETGYVDPASAESMVCESTTWFAVGHASNVTGRVQDIDRWSDLAHRSGAKLLVDASQTLGYLAIDMQTSRIDALAAAGHKGLRALAGTGILVLQPELHSQLRPLMYGGTGVASEQLAGGVQWPQSVEVGNLNMPGVVSMAVAAAEVEQQLDEHRRRWQSRLQQLTSGLACLPGVELFGWNAELDSNELDSNELQSNELTAAADYTAGRIPVVSLRVAGWDVHDLASVLDSFGIEVRAGWHCAALVHESLGSAEGGGTLRLSPGVSTTAEDIDYVLSIFRRLVA